MLRTSILMLGVLCPLAALAQPVMPGVPLGQPGPQDSDILRRSQRDLTTAPPVSGPVVSQPGAGSLGGLVQLDGRIVITAVKEFGATRGVGVELDEARIQEANENARRAGVATRVEFRRQDLFQTDLHAATVVALYLSPEINQKLRPKFLVELKPGARIVSHVFDMGDWTPAERRLVSGRPVFLWKVDGR